MFKNKTEQNRHDEKYGQIGITVKIYTSHNGFRATTIMLRPIAAGSLIMAISSHRSEASLGRPSNEQQRARSDVLSEWVEGHISHCSWVLQCCHPEQSSCSGKFWLLFIHKTLSLNNLFSNCHVKKNMWGTNRPDLTEHLTFRFCVGD